MIVMMPRDCGLGTGTGFYFMLIWVRVFVAALGLRGLQDELSPGSVPGVSESRA